MAKSAIDLEELAFALKEHGDPWESGDTSMTALSREEMERHLGFEPPPDGPSMDEMVRQLEASPARDAFMAAASLGAPPAFDLRNVGGRNYVTPVKNQGSCGSCVSFGVCTVIETSVKLAAGDPALDVDLSEAHLFYCHGRGQGRTCANGWWPARDGAQDGALDLVQRHALAFETSYPYTPGDQNCTNLDGGWRSRRVEIAGRSKLSGAQIKEWIATRGPVTGCFVVFEDFRAYRSGVYRHVSGAQVGGHCVAIVGYDDSQSCWICKNSWGTGWGEGGYFRIAYSECGIDSWFGPYGAVEARVATEAGAWSGWHSQGGVLTSDIVAAANADGRLEAFARGTDGAVWHKWQLTPNGGWSSWASLGGVITSRIAVARNADGRLEVFARGTDNALWHTWQVVPSGAWSGWASEGGVITSDPAVGQNADGRLEVFARGTDNALWHKWQVAPNGGWSGWASQGGLITSNIAVGRNLDGRLEAFVRGTDNALWHKWQLTPSGAWSGWASQGGVLTSDIAVGHNGDGRLEVFVRGTDNALWHKWQLTPSGAWSAWSSEGGVLTSRIAIGRSPAGRLEAFVRGTDNALWHKWQLAPNGAWSAWASEGGVLLGEVGVGHNADGRLEVFARGTDNALWHNWQTRVFTAVQPAEQRPAQRKVASRTYAEAAGGV